MLLPLCIRSSYRRMLKVPLKTLCARLSNNGRKKKASLTISLALSYFWTSSDEINCAMQNNNTNTNYNLIKPFHFITLLSSSSCNYSSVLSVSVSLRVNSIYLSVTLVVTDSPFSAMSYSMFTFSSLNQPKLSAIKCNLSQPSHLIKTTPFSYDSLLNVRAYFVSHLAQV